MVSALKEKKIFPENLTSNVLSVKEYLAQTARTNFLTKQPVYLIV
jgi:hypothetical protein